MKSDVIYNRVAIMGATLERVGNTAINCSCMEPKITVPRVHIVLASNGDVCVSSACEAFLK